MHDVDAGQLGLRCPTLKNQEVRVIFPGMKLPENPRDTRPIPPDDNEDILRVVAEFQKVQDDFNMGHPLDACAHFILTFHNQDAVRFQDTACFNGCANVEFQNRVVPLAPQRSWPITV